MLQYQSANLTFRTVHMAKQNFEVIQIGKWRVLVDKKDAKRVLFKKWRIYLQGGSPRIVTNVTCDRQMTLARFILCPGRNEIAFPKSVNKVGGCWDFRRENLTLGRRGDRIRFLPKNSKRRTSRYKGVSKDAGDVARIYLGQWHVQKFRSFQDGTRGCKGVQCRSIRSSSKACVFELILICHV